MSNSSLPFSPSEIRLATATLCAIAAAIPTFYLFRSSFSQPQESTPHVQTFRKFIKAYSSLRPNALVANASADFTHTVLPASLQMPTRSLEPFKGHAAMIFGLFEDFEMIPQPVTGPNSVHFCKETNTVIAHCKMGGKVNGAKEPGSKLVEQGVTEWWTECVLMVRMSEDGKRIVEVREFVHSAKAKELKKRIMGVLTD